jgi:hypothetical protein
MRFCLIDSESVTVMIFRRQFATLKLSRARCHVLSGNIQFLFYAIRATNVARFVLLLAAVTVRSCTCKVEAKEVHILSKITRCLL